jgi:hypothetical protein
MDCRDVGYVNPPFKARHCRRENGYFLILKTDTMENHSASRSLSLGQLLRLFIFSRGVLGFTAIAVCVACRVAIPKPFRWFEAVTVAGILIFWPKIELLVHDKMHNAVGTKLYNRHKLHHEQPLDDTALGKITTFLIYNLLPLPWLAIRWPTAVTATTVVVVALTIYEFVHFSTHFRYRPLTAWGNRVRNNHLLHHRDPSTRLEVVFPRHEATTLAAELDEANSA